MIIVQTSEIRSHCRPNVNCGNQEKRNWCAPAPAVASFHDASAAMNETPISAEPIGPAMLLSCGPNAQSITAPNSGSSQTRNNRG